MPLATHAFEILDFWQRFNTYLHVGEHVQAIAQNAKDGDASGYPDAPDRFAQRRMAAQLTFLNLDGVC